MGSLSRQDQLRQLLTELQERMRQTFPSDKIRAISTLSSTQDARFLKSHDTFQLTTQRATTQISYLYSSGWHKALQFCFAPELFQSAPTDSADFLDLWADQFLQQCDSLAQGEQILAYCETGFMRMQQGGEKDFSVWIAGKMLPTAWREREDIDWWMDALASTHQHEMQELAGEQSVIQQHLATVANQWQGDRPIYTTTPEIDDYYMSLGRLRVKSMACHLLYPDQTLLGGCTVEHYRDVLAVLIGWALKHLDLCRAYVVQHPSFSLRALLAPLLQSTALIEALSETLGIDTTIIRRVIDAYSLSRENISYHCSVAGVPVPPLLRVGEQHLIWSFTGLLSEPFFFLTRELKRRYSSEYHTAARLREELFRQDLYRLFSDKRFVRSTSSIELRGVQGDLTTDVDALIFDRKTGTLALFELKSQDPFAYSPQERIRQRDYFYTAGKQVLACVQWLNRNGANALLTRMNSPQVKRLRVQKTYIFVLGRYLAHFSDGPAFDQRAAWGTWPQVLRLENKTSFRAEDTHSIQSLHSRLQKATPLAPLYPVPDVQKITIGDSNVYVYASFQTYKGSD